MGFVVTSNTEIEEKLSSEEFASVKSAKQDLVIALAAEEKFAIVGDNLNDFERYLLQATQDYVISSEFSYMPAMIVRREIDRKLINLLSVCRLYFDQISHLINDTFGPNSSEEKRISVKRSELYDRSFAYRILEALRNFVQHRALPVENFAFNRHRVEDGEGVLWETSIIPRLSAAVLEADGGFKKSVLNELKEHGGLVDIRPLVREYISLIFEVHQLVRELVATRVSQALPVLESYLVRFPEAAFLEAVEKDGRGKHIQRVPLFREFLDHYRHLTKKFQTMKLLAQSYVSSRQEKKSSKL